ncbi:MAG: prohibitin family protein [Anaerostipes sp.]|uniref:prohibitin family protein n=1 Tax=Anaerostipes sp. TaxID=1872530 RepID=UPI003991A84D
MILKILLLVITGFVFGFNAYNKKDGFKPNKKCCYALIPFVLFILSFCVTYVPANNVGVRYSAISGTSNKTLNEGITFKLPIDKIYCIPTTVEERTIKKMNVQTKDAQFVTSEVNVKFQVNKKDAFKVYKRYTTLDSLKQNIISNYAQKSIESVVTKYNVIDVLGAKKNEVYALSTKDLEEKLKSEGIKLVSLTIKNMNAGEEIEQAIADEAVAKKRVETAEQNRLKAKKDAETKLINAQAESDANKILEKQLTDKILKQQLIAKWDGKLPAVTSGNENILDIDSLIE